LHTLYLQHDPPQTVDHYFRKDPEREFAVELSTLSMKLATDLMTLPLHGPNNCPKTALIILF